MSRRSSLVGCGILGMGIATSMALTGCESPQSLGIEPASTRGSKQAAAWKAQLPPTRHEEWAKLGYRLDWQSPVFVPNSASRNTTRVKATADAILVQDSTSTVSFVEPATGRVRWATELANPLSRFLSLDLDPANPRHVLASAEGELFVLASDTGALIERERFARVVNTAPVFAPGLAIYGCSAGEILAHTVGTEFRAWGFDGHSTFTANPVYVGDAIGFVGQNGNVLFLNAAGSMMGFTKIYDGPAGQPATDGERLFIASTDQSLWAISPNGQTAWRHKTPAKLTRSPVVHDSFVYCELPAGFSALHADTGTLVWTTPKLHGEVIAIRDGKLVVWEAPNATLVDPKTGDIIASAEIPEATILAAESLVDAPIYVANPHGTLTRFVPQN